MTNLVNSSNSDETHGVGGLANGIHHKGRSIRPEASRWLREREGGRERERERRGP